MRTSPFKLFLGLLYATAFVAIAHLAWEGLSYYATPLIDRPRHEDFWSLKPGGSRGHLYLQIPRTRAGDELSLAEVEELRAEPTRKLREELHLPEGALAELDRIALGGISPATRLAILLFHLPFQAVSLRMRLLSFRRRLQRQLAGAPPRLLRGVTRLARQKALLERRLVLWSRLQQLFHYWHVFHKPFAVVMYVFMVVHIAVALLTGYGWSS